MAESVGPKFDHTPAQGPPPAAGQERAREGAIRSSAGQHAPGPAAPSPGDPPAGGNFAASEVVADLWSRVADVDPIVYYWEEPPEARGRDARESREESSPLFPGHRPLYKRSAPPPRAEEELANVIAFLQNLRVSVRRADPPGEPAEPGQSVLQSKRLTRTGVTPNPFQIGAPPRTWSPPRMEAKSEPEPAEKPAAEKPGPRPEVSPAAKPVRPARRHAAWLVLAGGFSLVTLCLAAPLWTRIGPPPPADVAPGSRVPRGKPAHAQEARPSQEALNLTNLALEAIQQGDLKKASGFLDDARGRGAGLSGFFYQAALLAFSQGQSREADDFLGRSIEANEAVADCWYLRANASFFAAGPDKAAEAFEQAAYAAPFSPRYYFFRAECLRRSGHTAAALEQFQQALRCRPSSADTELILFKVGLTRLEAGADLPFKTEMSERLSQEPVAGDTLLLAAADAISRSEYAEGAADLKRAALVLPPRVFQSRVRDYVFQAQAQQPDLAPVLKPPAPSNSSGQPTRRAARLIVDPATRGLAEADPAGW